MHFDTESCDVLLLELASKVTLDESSLKTNPFVSNVVPRVT